MTRDGVRICGTCEAVIIHGGLCDTCIDRERAEVASQPSGLVFSLRVSAEELQILREIAPFASRPDKVHAILTRAVPS